MPINESSGRTRSNLTKAQRLEAEAAIYGRSPEQIKNTMNLNELTPEVIEQLRGLLQQHDAAHPKMPKEFDLNNPPKLPYSYQEFPRIVYHHGKRIHDVAKNAVDLDEALTHGWSKEPFPMESESSEPSLSAADLAEISALDKKLKEKRTQK
jgi:hypothetical protein